MTAQPLRTTVIGSYPFPGWLEFACQHLGQFGDADRAEMIDDAVAIAVKDQLDAGLDVITDGEQTRLDFNLSFYGFIEGIELESAPPRRYGPFKTTGWMEETFQLNDGSLSEERFLKDLLIDMDRDRGILLGEMARGGKCVFHVFTQTDRASHCFFWRRDPAHPAYDRSAAARLKDPLKDVYRRMDAIVGEVASRLEADDLLIVASDHGFQSWRRERWPSG